MLLHAKQYWPEYITTILWPYALKATEDHCSKYDIDVDGPSSAHAGNVHLVLNPCTGHVLLQFHVFFYDPFATAPHLQVGTIPLLWTSLVAIKLLPPGNPHL
eukprot:13582831-Ditylum_brightwellii.AAC.1